MKIYEQWSDPFYLNSHLCIKDFRNNLFVRLFLLSKNEIGDISINSIINRFKKKFFKEKSI